VVALADAGLGAAAAALGALTAAGCFARGAHGLACAAMNAPKRAAPARTNASPFHAGAMTPSSSLPETPPALLRPVV
jgi:hypothetical protein